MILQTDTQNSGTNVPTASQTVGPFFSIGMCQQRLSNLVPADLSTGTEVLTIRGRVLDGDGQGVPDAILEIWRADRNGNYTGAQNECDSSGVPGGFGRIPTNQRGEFEFQTVKPGSIVSNTGEVQAPHLAVLIFMRGLLKQLVTRIYFPQESDNECDAALKAVPAERRHTLIAAQPGSDKNELQWHVHLQGDSETVFFEA